jgi:2-keto-3-deoxy-L-rhamnonate aldolase RhmA
VSELVEPINERTLTMVQFEHIDTLKELDQILELPELDMLFVGPNDLAVSMGVPGQLAHPQVQAVIDQVVARTKESGKWLGTVAPDPESANRQIERGFQLVAANVPGLLIQGLKAYMSGVKRP